MKPLVTFVLPFCFAATLAGCACREKLYHASPSQLPHTTRSMKTAGFWIGRHPCPDETIFSAEQIADVNAHIRNDLKLTKDIAGFPASVPGEELRTSLEDQLARLRERPLLMGNGRKAAEQFYGPLQRNMNLRSISCDVDVRYGLVLRFADQRLLPTARSLYAIAGDIDFDELQNSALDLGTAVAVLHESAGGKWYYVQSDLSAGWVEADHVVLCSLEQLRDYLTRRDSSFVVATRAKTDVFLDESLTEFHEYIRMGVALPLGPRESSDVVGVVIPFRNDDGSFTAKDAYVRSCDVHRGFRPYTPRVVIEQAFELLDTPYGWGGQYGEQDCSRFLQEVFATVGMALPRNSGDQCQVGTLLADFAQAAAPQEKLGLLKARGVGGITILKFRNPSHVAMFLGMVDGRPYIVHSAWGYRQRLGFSEVVRVINRTSVAELHLGEGSTKGSLLDRLASVRILSR